MKKLIFLIFILTSLIILAEDSTPKKSIPITLENNDSNKSYDIERNPTAENYDYYEKRGEKSPQFDNLSFLGKVGIVISSWFASSDTYEHIDNKDNSNLDKKLDTYNRKVD